MIIARLSTTTSRRVTRQRRSRIKRNLDVPRVQHVLVESQSDSRRQIELERTERQLERGTLVVRQRRHPIEQSPIGDQHVGRPICC